MQVYENTNCSSVVFWWFYVHRMVRKQVLLIVTLTEASKQETAMVFVALRMLFIRPKSQPGLHPSTGLCVWWAIGRLWGHVFSCLVANIPFTVFDSTSLCDFSGKKYERNQSANKLRVLSQRGEEKEKKDLSDFGFWQNLHALSDKNLHCYHR